MQTNALRIEALAAHDFAATRLFVVGPLAEGARLAASPDQVNLLVNVLRLAEGTPVLVFDGASGEWRARIEKRGKRELNLLVEARTREQTVPTAVHLLFAPLKHARLDYMAQKAVEMGAARLTPVLTRRTQVARLNLDRLNANAIEAAEQCGVLSIPEVDDLAPLDKALARLEPDRLLVFCDEDAPPAKPIEALAAHGPPGRPLAVLIGPEGGFAPQERAMLATRQNAIRLSLGPRILRADTAAVAALAIVQAALGDWR